jgi:hypothetical protein
MQPFVQALPAESRPETRNRTSFCLGYADFATKPNAECPRSSIKIAQVAISYIVSSLRTKTNALVVLLEKFGEIAGAETGVEQAGRVSPLLTVLETRILTNIDRGNKHGEDS